MIDTRWLLIAADVIIVAFLIYRLMLLVRGTRAAQMLVGLAVLVLLSILAEWLHLATLNWLLNSLRTVWVIAFLIIFQPELRRALTQIGQSGIFRRIVHVADYGWLGEIEKVLEELSKRGQGALIVLERNVGLRTYLETGTQIGGKVTMELLLTIFTPPSPLHDGAVIIQGDEVAAAGCILPLSQRHDLESTLGTRHRAALGLSEETDAVVLVVSEETHHISIAERGVIQRNVSPNELKGRLSELLSTHTRPRKTPPAQGVEASS
ncbi:MAG: diadenylate cyclase CdaA [Candidatus Eisenbacteria bacterium]|uniref:Diadenylate cyclase n=1 Tax=Eiseniibacteriota bacterium TaxID=2212470 RepID=A0A948W3F2_UNCEI|nr:diadenylate cyclase CdaA [Candidatus Eisenbacteria bacterium]MBU1950756.1 diadenylate cyclase CdaA [Candidatus Eisenbacteria bacterium]MBU2691027.1 diadenylate cyclase CdaA [Candidatus Eisenbacteria bacterium]